ncbi:MAG: hypothetical protein EON54_05120 [Alcaligenaceae bacterium]|nr:MAG: hypothetical protein EON54_05120 [Alcaligenaceae bacterium]
MSMGTSWPAARAGSTRWSGVLHQPNPASKVDTSSKVDEAPAAFAGQAVVGAVRVDRVDRVGEHELHVRRQVVRLRGARESGQRMAPFYTPVYVPTDERRAPWVRPRGTTFHFINDGSERALTMARDTAGERDIRISGGTDVIQQYLNLGAVDELDIGLAPVLFGSGRHLFENVQEPSPQFRIESVLLLHGSEALHLRYVRRSGALTLTVSACGRMLP